MGKRSDGVESVRFRARVRELMAVGMGASAIAKQTGKSYKHTCLIMAQESGDPIPYRITEAGRAMLRDAQQGVE